MTEFVRTLKTLELVGGALCLDFANTINSRLNPEHDYLVHYADLIGWANKVGILTPAQASQLQKRAKQNENEADAAWNEAQRLRELLYKIFSNVVQDLEPTQKDMKLFARVFGEAISRGQLMKANHHYRIKWNIDETFGAVLWPIVHSAGELLQSEDLHHVKECPGCGWLFLDTSKNQSRRWCSMNTCGARDKMRRYHKRKQSK